jgi:hypothetical protein
LRCDEARRRLAVNAEDARAGRHLQGCAVCFAVLEADDPLAGALRAARPADVAAPDGLADAVLARWRPTWARPPAVLTAGLAVAALAIAAAIELMVGAEPGRLAGLSGTADILLDGMAGLLVGLLALRSALFETPAALTAFGAVTLAACVLWFRLALRPPAWGSAR